MLARRLQYKYARESPRQSATPNETQNGQQVALLYQFDTAGSPVGYWVVPMPQVTIGKNTCSWQGPPTHTVTSYVGQG